MRASIQKIQLTGTIVIAVSSILLATLAALPSVSSYLRYRTNAQQLSRFETALQSAWLVSAERGPANNLMGASSPMQNWSRSLPQRARRRTTSWWNSKTLCRGNQGAARIGKIAGRYTPKTGAIPRSGRSGCCTSESARSYTAMSNAILRCSRRRTASTCCVARPLARSSR